MSRILAVIGLMLLILALAGPRAGKGEAGVVIGRDLVIVLDFSKSMLVNDMRDANKPQRWQAAVAAVSDLVDYLQQRGGHRIGLVVFATKPWVVCPLTADYDHFRARLEEYTPTYPPIEILPHKGEGVFPSGTRIGYGIAEGRRICDERFDTYQDLILISDGSDPDDPAGRDANIDYGIRIAQQRSIPVHTVGVGDPDAASMIKVGPVGDEDLLGESKLEESVLQDIARRTKGEYLPARQQRPDLVDFFATKIEPRPSRVLEDDVVPQPREQYAWLLIPAVAMMLLAFTWELRR